VAYWTLAILAIGMDEVRQAVEVHSRQEIGNASLSGPDFFEWTSTKIKSTPTKRTHSRIIQEESRESG